MAINNLEFSYDDNLLVSSTNITATQRNQVRLLIGDVNSTDRLFTDDEISFFVDQEANIYGAASVAAMSLQFRYSGQADKKVGDLSISLSQKSNSYRDLAKDYKAKSEDKGAPQIFMGGATISGKNTDRSNTDLVQPAFNKWQNDFPTVSSNSTLSES